MANNRLVLNTEEFRRELRNLPTELVGDATGIVMDAATSTKSVVGAVYDQHRHTGNLAGGLTLNVQSIGPHGSAAVVESRSEHAWLFDNGTAARHKASGSSTGAMWGKTPPTHIFVKTAIRMRRVMYERLRALMQGKGLTVTGTVK